MVLALLAAAAGAGKYLLFFHKSIIG